MQYALSRLKDILDDAPLREVDRRILAALLRCAALYYIEGHDRYCDAYGCAEKLCTCFRGTMLRDFITIIKTYDSETVLSA